MGAAELPYSDRFPLRKLVSPFTPQHSSSQQLRKLAMCDRIRELRCIAIGDTNTLSSK